MYGNPNFTPLAPTKSEVIRTPQEMMARARAAYDRQAENAQARQEKDAQARLAAQDQAAQNLLDYFKDNPASYTGQQYIYDPLYGVNVAKQFDPNDFTATPMYYQGAGNGRSTLADGTFNPTLDDAKALLAGTAGYNYTAFQKGDTPIDTIKRAFGGGISDDAANYLLSLGLKDQGDRTVGDIRDNGIVYSNRFADTDKPLAAWTGPDQVGLKNLFKDAGADWTSFNPLPTGQSAADWNSIVGGVNNKIAQQDERNRYANLAYNNYTLGGGYGGGMINDSYSAPFAGSMDVGQNWYGWGGGSGATMPEAAQSWNTPSYGQPNSPLSGSYGGLGGLGGFGGRGRGNGWGGGPWGSQNPWSPS